MPHFSFVANLLDSGAKRPESAVNGGCRWSWLSRFRVIPDGTTAAPARMPTDFAHASSAQHQK